jgi:hypothetical protein
MVRGVYVWPDARDLRLCGMVMGVRSGPSEGVADRRTRCSLTRRPSGVAKRMALRLGSPVGTGFQNRDAIRLIKRMRPQRQTHVHKDCTSRRANRRAIPVTRGGVTPLFMCYRKRMTRRSSNLIVMRVMTALANHMATPQPTRLYRDVHGGQRQYVSRCLIPRLDTCAPGRVTIHADTDLNTDVETRMVARLTSCSPANMATGMQTESDTRVTRRVLMRLDTSPSGHRTSDVGKRTDMSVRSGL